MEADWFAYPIFVERDSGVTAAGMAWTVTAHACRKDLVQDAASGCVQLNARARSAQSGRHHEPDLPASGEMRQSRRQPLRSVTQAIILKFSERNSIDNLSQSWDMNAGHFRSALYARSGAVEAEEP